MGTVTIDQLPLASALTGYDFIPVSQGSVTKKARLGSFRLTAENFSPTQNIFISSTYGDEYRIFNLQPGFYTRLSMFDDPSHGVGIISNTSRHGVHHHEGGSSLQFFAFQQSGLNKIRFDSNFFGGMYMYTSLHK